MSRPRCAAEASHGLGFLEESQKHQLGSLSTAPLAVTRQTKKKPKPGWETGPGQHGAHPSRPEFTHGASEPPRPCLWEKTQLEELAWPL